MQSPHSSWAINTDSDILVFHCRQQMCRCPSGAKYGARESPPVPLTPHRNSTTSDTPYSRSVLRGRYAKLAPHHRSSIITRCCGRPAWVSGVLVALFQVLIFILTITRSNDDDVISILSRSILSDRASSAQISPSQ